MQFHGNSFARIESDWTFTAGDKSLLSKVTFHVLDNQTYCGTS